MASAKSRNWCGVFTSSVFTDSVLMFSLDLTAGSVLMFSLLAVS
jgi:hypothetical protein